MFHIFILLFFSSFSKLRSKTSLDYWTDDFDEDKNCEKEEIITRLRRETGGERCAVKTKGRARSDEITFLSDVSGSDEVQWEGCLNKLTKKLVFKCMPRNIETVNIIPIRVSSFSLDIERREGQEILFLAPT